MGYAINIKIFGELIEDFLVNHFNNLEAAGSVQAKEEGNINFIHIDLSFLKDWDQNSEKLVKDIHAYLNSLFKAKPLDLFYMTKFKNLTLDIKTPDTSHHLSKTLQLFYTDGQIGDNRKNPNKAIVWAEKHWQTIITVSTTFGIASLSFFILTQSPGKKEAFLKGLEQVVLFAGIISAFVLSYVLTKVIAIRQEKLARVTNVRELSYKLTCFRKICYHLRKDHWFWNDSVSYNYAKNISKMISYDDARFPDYDNDAKYASYRSLIITDTYSVSIIMFYLQLYMFAGEEFEDNANLAWGSYPPFIIYSHDEVYNYTTFLEFDEFWNCIDYDNQKFDFNHQKFHIDPIEKAASNYNLEGLDKATFSEEMILKIASDIQNKVLPELYHLTRLNEAKVPYVITYLIFITSIMMVFSVIYPIVMNVLSDSFIIVNLNGFIILGLIVDLILRLPILVSLENNLNRPDDYR